MIYFILTGLRAVKQLKASVWGEIQEWISNWQPDPFKIIVKPMDSAGSDDVTLCRSIDEVKAAFGNIMGKVNGLGIVNKVLKSPLFIAVCAIIRVSFFCCRRCSSKSTWRAKSTWWIW